MDVTITKFYSFIKKMCFFISDITFLFWFYVYIKVYPDMEYCIWISSI
ncbi:hypothetical protein BOVAB4_934 [Bacteroides ovatus]|uniref:Uncharacterized protein n=1 Tax=Bacteroides ovatus TaxID=28116 RepID=A0A1G6G1J5_BACOV|nr:hypothetical protein HMPREF1017_02202 [Bacteroides ovatus 3_8_47FAA]KDS16081.1 hypothetical protein M088_0975 [Bacteroides ovatus str. 3725 D1 iv]KDS21575.1 hypothetical protein M082_0774 [Bacteroides fragilis str. 3725 D9 ii]CAG9900235.1 hypothetical protein BOVA514_4953 [Bacteroides ovatus]CAG9907150.1 hypothetical protein BOVAB4_934 [Bacteroides ovatus]